MLIYDCEIEKAIAGRGEKLQGIDYCQGWRDFEGMGITCIGAYDYEEDRYRMFLKDNFSAFGELLERHEVIVGFNSIGFDNRLCFANGLIVPQEKSYDLLVEIWKAAGLGDHFAGPDYTGYGLDAMCEANFGLKKSGDGALAPVQWQRREFGTVIDYCLNDVRLTKRLLDKVLENSQLMSPKETGRVLTLAHPTVAGGAV